MSSHAISNSHPTIVVDNVSRWFGSVVAVNEVSLEIRPGITGLLGPNGAGKTTLLHMIAGLAKVSEGKIEVLGQPVRDNPELYRNMGVMAEHDALYDFYTGRQFVELAAKLHGLQNIPDAADKAIKSVNLIDAQHRKMGGYSRGMRQRMRLAATMVHDPQVLLLDEPLSGTDPRQRLEFQDLMHQIAGEGRTLVISSHILEEVEVLADNILLMISGKLAAAGDFRAIRAKLDERPYTVSIKCSDPRAMASGLVKMGEIESVSVDPEGGLTVLSRSVGVIQKAVPQLAKELGIRLTQVEPLDDSLESVFSYLVEA